MSVSSLTRTVSEPFTYSNGVLVGQSANGNSWETVFGAFASPDIISGTARTLVGATCGAVLRSANLPDKWANGFTLAADLKTDSLTVGHNHFDIQFGSNTPPGTQCVAVIFNTADASTTNVDLLDNIHIYNPSGGVPDQYTYLIPFTQNVTHHVVITFTPNSLTTTIGVLTVSVDNVSVVTNTVDFTGVTDGVATFYGIFNTASRWTIDNLVITSTYPAGRATTGGVAAFPQGVGGFNRVFGYRTYDAPSTLAPNNHTALFDLGTLVDNLTIANPVDDGSGFVEAQRFEVIFKSSAAGNKTLTWGNKYKFGLAPVSAAALTTIVGTSNQNVRVLFEYDSALAAFVCTRLTSGY